MSVFDEYFAAIPEPEKTALERVRQFVRRAVPGAEESVSYGMPAFKYKGRPLLGLRVAKDHLSLFPFSPAAVSSARKELAGFDLSKGTVRFSADKPVPDSALEQLLSQRLREIEAA
ncbi:MAG: DUF1801 domain-containing protein [Gaiellaceae bacterium]